MSFLRMWMLAALCSVPALVQAQDGGGGGATNPFTQFNWVHGPTNADLKGIAEIKVPEGFVFTGMADTRRMIEMMGDRPDGSEMGFMAPAVLLGTNANTWLVFFSFDDTGHVKDDDKDKLDADKLLKVLKDAMVQQNAERKTRGAPPLTITGWEQPPKYNPETHNLEWAIRVESEGGTSINYETRLLGRTGVTVVQLVVDPAQLATTMPAYQSLLTGYAFKQGKTYAEYKTGDKLATYGLVGLVTAGSLVVAAKTGLLAIILAFGKKLWVLLVAGVAAVVNYIKRLFGGGKNKSDSGSAPPP